MKRPPGSGTLADESQQTHYWQISSSGKRRRYANVGARAVPDSGDPLIGPGTWVLRAVLLGGQPVALAGFLSLLCVSFLLRGRHRRRRSLGGALRVAGRCQGRRHQFGGGNRRHQRLSAASGAGEQRGPVFCHLLCGFAALLCRIILADSARPHPGSPTHTLASARLVPDFCGDADLCWCLSAPEKPHDFPWSLRPETSVIIGWAFLGAACYFIYGLLYPRWDNAGGQLLGFLGYDLILIIPFLRHFADVPSDHAPSLIVYVIAIVYSGALAVYYLFINRSTRHWALAPQTSQSAAGVQSPTA